MAVMEKQQKQQREIVDSLDGLGPFGILREALKLSSTHAVVFTLICIALMLPLLNLALAAEHFLYPNLPELYRLPPGTSSLTHLPFDFIVSYHHVGWPLGLGPQAVFLSLFTTAAVSIAFQAALNLSISAMLHCVGLHYTNRAVTFPEVLKASIPLLWIRLTITTTYCYLLLYSVVALQSLGALILFQIPITRPKILFGEEELGPLLLNPRNVISVVVLFMEGALVGLSFLTAVSLDMIMMIASSVSVLEEEYGWGAVRKSLKLLVSKWTLTVALLFQLLWAVPVVIQLAFLRDFRYRIFWWDRSEWSSMVMQYETIGYLIGTSFLWQLKTSCAGIQYAAFKAYYHEDLGDPFLGQYEVVEGGKGRDSMQRVLLRL